MNGGRLGDRRIGSQKVLLFVVFEGIQRINRIREVRGFGANINAKNENCNNSFQKVFHITMPVMCSSKTKSCPWGSSLQEIMFVLTA